MRKITILPVRAFPYPKLVMFNRGLHRKHPPHRLRSLELPRHPGAVHTPCGDQGAGAEKGVIWWLWFDGFNTKYMCIYIYIYIYIYSIIEFYVAIGSRCLKLYRCLYTDTYFADEVGLKLLDFVASLAVDLCRHDESTWASQHRPLGCRSSELSPHLWDMGLKLSVLNAFHHS